jgi:hypothetical protein
MIVMTNWAKILKSRLLSIWERLDIHALTTGGEHLVTSDIDLSSHLQKMTQTKQTSKTTNPDCMKDQMHSAFSCEVGNSFGRACSKCPIVHAKYTAGTIDSPRVTHTARMLANARIISKNRSFSLVKVHSVGMQPRRAIKVSQPTRLLGFFTSSLHVCSTHSQQHIAVSPKKHIQRAIAVVISFLTAWSI